MYERGSADDCAQGVFVKFVTKLSNSAVVGYFYRVLAKVSASDNWLILPTSIMR